MSNHSKEVRKPTAKRRIANRIRRFAWVPIVVVDVGFLLWGGMAALAPDHLLGPHSTPIIIAGYEGYTNGSWSALVETSPRTAAYITALFRTYGAYNVAFSLSAIAVALTAFRRDSRWAWWALLLGNTIALGAAMTYDRLAHAIGPFEVTEYIGLVLVWVALGLTVPYRFERRSPRRVARELS